MMKRNVINLSQPLQFELPYRAFEAGINWAFQSISKDLSFCFDYISIWVAAILGIFIQVNNKLPTANKFKNVCSNAVSNILSFVVFRVNTDLQNIRTHWSKFNCCVHRCIAFFGFNWTKTKFIGTGFLVWI